MAAASHRQGSSAVILFTPPQPLFRRHLQSSTFTQNIIMEDVPEKNDDVPTAPPRTAACTPLERRLTSWCCFFFVLVCDIFLRIFLWPYFSGNRYLVFIVVGTRIPVGVAWVRLHQYLTGEEDIEGWVQVATTCGILLVDLGLGSCYVSCTVKPWARGFCKYG